MTNKHSTMTLYGSSLLVPQFTQKKSTQFLGNQV